MTWIRDNKFIAGLLAAVFVAAGVLTFLVYSAYSKYAEASESYDQQAAELKRLQNLAPYPSEENLAKFRDQKNALATSISGLAQALDAAEFKEEPLRPNEFQDRLRAAVSATAEKATRNGVALPEGFYLGNNEYQTTLPKDDAAAASLGRDLKAMEFVVNTLIESKPASIVAITRIAAPQVAASPTPGAKGPARPSPAAAAPPLVTKRSFDLSFITDQPNLRKFLNAVTSAQQQLYVTRAIRIKNQAEKGPARADAPTADAAVPSPAADGGATGEAKPANLRFIIGTEKLEVAARFDYLDFNPPAVPVKK